MDLGKVESLGCCQGSKVPNNLKKRLNVSPSASFEKS